MNTNMAFVCARERIGRRKTVAEERQKKKKNVHRTILYIT